MTNFRDTMTIWQDVRAEGDEQPSYTQKLVSAVPCEVKQIAGDETWRGRQLQEHIDYVVLCWYSRVFESVAATDQVEITSGVFAGRRLNLRFPRVYQYNNGKPPVLELFCREGAA